MRIIFIPDEGCVNEVEFVGYMDVIPSPGDTIGIKGKGSQQYIITHRDFLLTDLKNGCKCTEVALWFDPF